MVLLEFEKNARDNPSMYFFWNCKSFWGSGPETCRACGASILLEQKCRDADQLVSKLQTLVVTNSQMTKSRHHSFRNYNHQLSPPAWPRTKPSQTGAELEPSPGRSRHPAPGMTPLIQLAALRVTTPVCSPNAGCSRCELHGPMQEVRLLDLRVRDTSASRSSL